jgi:hypothetical protein
MAFKELKNEEITSVDLRFEKALGWVVFTILVIFVFVDVYLIVSVLSGIDLGGFGTVSGIAIILAITAAFFYGWSVARFTWYRIDDKGITNHGLWTRHFSMRWEEIDRIEGIVTTTGGRGPHATVYGFYVIGNGHSFKLMGNYYPDLPKFSVMIRKHLPQEKWIDAKDVVMFYYNEIYSNRESSPIEVTDSAK